MPPLIGREGSLIVIVHRYIDIFNDTGTLHALSEHAVTNQRCQLWGGALASDVLLRVPGAGHGGCRRLGKAVQVDIQVVIRLTLG